MVRRFWWSSFVHGIAIGQVPRVFGLVDERSSYCSIYPALEYRIDTVLHMMCASIQTLNLCSSRAV
jgi:hypothetical protein